MSVIANTALGRVIIETLLILKSVYAICMHIQLADIQVFLLFDKQMISGLKPGDPVIR